MHETRAFHVSDNVYIYFGKLPRIKQIIIVHDAESIVHNYTLFYLILTVDKKKEQPRFKC